MPRFCRVVGSRPAPSSLASERFIRSSYDGRIARPADDRGAAGVAALRPLINASGAVEALPRVILMQAGRLGENPLRIRMPMAFAAGAGSHLALTGAPKNVLIADAVAEVGAGAIGFFDFALVGLPLLAGTCSSSGCWATG